ncbi:MAG: hypothetical protein ACM31O_01455 [Bacteroidota bacterium]
MTHKTGFKGVFAHASGAPMHDRAAPARTVTHFYDMRITTDPSLPPKSWRLAGPRTLLVSPDIVDEMGKQGLTRHD